MSGLCRLVSGGVSCIAHQARYQTPELLVFRTMAAEAEEDRDRKVDNVAARCRVGSVTNEDRPAGRAAHEVPGVAVGADVQFPLVQHGPATPN